MVMSLVSKRNINVVYNMMFILFYRCLFHSEKAPKQVTPHAEIHLGQESHKNLSLGKHNWLNSPVSWLCCIEK